MADAICALVSWPSDFMVSLVKRALASSFDLDSEVQLHDSPEGITHLIQSTPGRRHRIVQWSTYDVMLHELTGNSLDPASSVGNDITLSSSYVIRKALIRKHFLHKTFVNYLAKRPESLLSTAIPKTWSIDIAFADELDELWADELYDLGELLDQNAERPNSDWFILKPGMSDRGMGIRLFKTREDLTRIFESFDTDEDDGNQSDEDNGGERISSDTGVTTSQLRHFVIQEYIPDPLLLDPSEAHLAGETVPKRAILGGGKKFHLRAYCVACGALSLYLCPNILALFAATPYSTPTYTSADASTVNLSAHLTNTSLQKDNPDTEGNVRLLSELAGCRVYPLSGETSQRTLSEENIADIVRQVRDVLSETFRAALASPIHFQALPNAFEIFGADLLVTVTGDAFQVKILELNAEPAIELTGARLGWVLDEFFVGVSKTCVAPFFKDTSSVREWGEGELRNGLIKCMDLEVRSSRAW